MEQVRKYDLIHMRPGMFWGVASDQYLLYRPRSPMEQGVRQVYPDEEIEIVMSRVRNFLRDRDERIFGITREKGGYVIFTEPAKWDVEDVARITGEPLRHESRRTDGEVLDAAGNDGYDCPSDTPPLG